MKKLGIIALALFIQNVSAQTNRFVYQVTMKPDAENKSDIKTENAYLDISPEKSVFYSENRIKRDFFIKNRISANIQVCFRNSFSGLGSNP